MRLCFSILIIATLLQGCVMHSDTKESSVSGGGTLSKSVHNQSYSGSTVVSESTDKNTLVVSQDGRLGPLRGEASFHTILGFISWGQKGVASAAQNAGIQQITHVEKTEHSFPFFYKRESTIVTGEPVVVKGSTGSPVTPVIIPQTIISQPQTQNTSTTPATTKPPEVVTKPIYKQKRVLPGILVERKEGYIEVMNVREGGPADRIGLRTGDRIIQVNAFLTHGNMRQAFMELASEESSEMSLRWIDAKTDQIKDGKMNLMVMVPEDVANNR